MPGWGLKPGGLQRYKKLTSYMKGQIGLSCRHFQLLSLQNVAKSIPDINIHLARRFQPVGYLSASTMQGHLKSTRALVGARQATCRNKPRGKQTEEDWTVK